jgi:hypothetical protein
MLSQLQFNNGLYDFWRDNYAEIYQAFQNQALTKYLNLVDPQAERLYTYFLLAAENSTRSLVEWQQLGYSQAHLTALLALSVEAGYTAKFNDDGSFTQKF